MAFMMQNIFYSKSLAQTISSIGSSIVRYSLGYIALPNEDLSQIKIVKVVAFDTLINHASTYIFPEKNVLTETLTNAVVAVPYWFIQWNINERQFHGEFAPCVYITLAQYAGVLPLVTVIKGVVNDFFSTAADGAESMRSSVPLSSSSHALALWSDRHYFEIPSRALPTCSLNEAPPLPDVQASKLSLLPIAGSLITAAAGVTLLYQGIHSYRAVENIKHFPESVASLKKRAIAQVVAGSMVAVAGIVASFYQGFGRP